MRNIAVFTILIIFSACGRKNNAEINYKYVTNMEDITDTLDLRETSSVRVYCTGELKPDWANIGRQYISQDDDIEIFFKRPNNGITRITFKSFEKKVDTLIVDSKEVRCVRTYNQIKRKYSALITIPCSLVFADEVSSGRSFEFDVAIGDNDDGIKQKSKLAWSSGVDPLYSRKLTGRLKLVQKQTFNLNNSIALATYVSNPNQDLLHCKRYPILNIVVGQINDNADFSGFYQAGWDEKNIYLRFEINDSKEGRFRKENLINDDNFVDRGWIEDLKGKKIWKMTLRHAKAAGGALKNQYCDTILKLNRGKYVIRYITDESHSWKNWDAPPPKKSFWGISVTAKYNN